MIALRQANSAGSMFSWRNLNRQIKNQRKIFSHTLMTLVVTVIIRLVALEICQGWHKGEDEGVKGSRPKCTKSFNGVKMRICSKCTKSLLSENDNDAYLCNEDSNWASTVWGFYFGQHCSLHFLNNSYITEHFYCSRPV